jgi:uncharacterized membrane protein
VISQAIVAIVFAAALGCGLVAGIFFAFSSFVMAALGRLPAPHGIAAMKAINVTVINPGFMLTFFGSGVLCLAAVACVALAWPGASGASVVVAAALYLGGSIGVTILGNVPLNNALAEAAVDTPEAAALWSRYLVEWTRWNTVRTVASAAAAELFTAALI